MVTRNGFFATIIGVFLAMFRKPKVNRTVSSTNSFSEKALDRAWQDFSQANLDACERVTVIADDPLDGDIDFSRPGYYARGFEELIFKQLMG